MARKIQSEDDAMSWAGLWSYYKSSRNEVRVVILKHMKLVEALDGATSGVRREILEFAPDEVKNDPEVLKVLEREPQMEIVNPRKFRNGMTPELFAMYKKRYDESMAKLGKD